MSNVTALRRPASKNAGSDDKRLAAAFRSLEPDICAMFRAVQIVDLAEEHDEDLVTFAIEQCLKVAEELKATYYEAYKG
jgi:hypothetical protein